MKLVIKSTRIIIVDVRRASVVIMLYSWFLGFFDWLKIFAPFLKQSREKQKPIKSLSRTCAPFGYVLLPWNLIGSFDGLHSLWLAVSTSLGFSRFTLTQSAYFLLDPHLMTYKKIHRPDINTLWSSVAERKQQFHFSLFFCFSSPLPKSPPNRQRNKVVCLVNELLFSSLYAHVT